MTTNAGLETNGRRSPYLRNAWYVAAWADDLGQEFVARTFLDIPVLLFRRQDGTPVAMRDECPHRFAPLSMGKRDGDTVICPYHGLTFDSKGACTDERYPEVSRSRACIQTFPVVERQKIIWIWPGDPARADPASIPDYSFFENPQRANIFGLTHVKANYQLEIDNLLDLSHLDYVHTATIGFGATRHGKHTVEHSGTKVDSNWMCASIPNFPIWELGPFPTNGGLIDHWMDMRWDAPASLRLDTGVTREGTSRDAGVFTLQGHFATPETEFSTHYFWGLSLPPAMQPIKDAVRAGTTQAFEGEDRPMLEAVQRRMARDEFWGKRPLILAEDSGAVRARKLLDQLIKAEGNEVAKERSRSRPRAKVAQ